MIHGRRHMVAIGARADEERHGARRHILRGERAERALDGKLGLVRRQVGQRGVEFRGGDVGEEGIDGGAPMRASISVRSSGVRGR